jgi:DNA polymerase III epsilon subunit family exonuclease
MAKSTCPRCGAALAAQALTVTGRCDACNGVVSEVTAFLPFDEQAPLELVAFDVETTGLSPASAGITEIGAVRFRPDGEIVDTFVSLANPGYPVGPDITRLTGITDAMLADARPAAEVLGAWLRWLGPDPILVAHNAPFDLQFIHATLNEVEFRAIDTLAWARERAWPVLDHKLETLLRHIGYTAARYHRAEADARGVVALCCRLAACEAAEPGATGLRDCIERRCQNSRQLCAYRRPRRRAKRP